MHPRFTRRFLLAVVAVALVCAVPGTVSAAPGDPIVADELPEGPPPTYSYVDMGTLVTPGQGTLDLPDGASSDLYKARGGWLTMVPVGGDGSLVLMRPDGGVRTVLPPPLSRRFRLFLVSSDGRLMVTRNGREAGRLEVYRISDGSRVARLRLDQDVYPLAMRPGRVLVAREPTPAHPEQYSLAWWDVAGRNKGDLTTIFRARRSWDENIRPLDTLVWVDLSAGQFVQRRRYTNVVRPLDGTGRTWELPATEYVGNWSPDDRLMVSAPQGDRMTRDADEVLLVRNHRTGNVVARFDGLFEAPVWETNDTFLLGAYSRAEPSTEGGYDAYGRETIRCRVSTQTCEKVLPSDHYPYFVRRKSN